MTDVRLETAVKFIVKEVPDGNFAIMFMGKETGAISGAVVNRDELSRLVSTLVEHAEKVAATRTPKPEQDRTMMVKPIPAVSVGFAQSEIPGQLNLVFDLAALSFVFAVDETALRQMCRDVLASEPKAQSKVTH